MIEIGALQIKSFVLDELTVSWEAEIDPDEDINEYEFIVLRSESPEGEFEIVSPGLIDTFTFIDKDVNTRNKWRKFYYKIEALHTPSGRVFSSEAKSSFIPTDMTLIGLEIARRERILLSGAGSNSGFVGIPCTLFIRRTFGPRCPECWDYIKRQIKGPCDACYGVGRYKGYMAPIYPVYFQIEPHAQSVDHSNIGELQHAQTSGWTSNYPLLSPGDVIIEPGNRRWRISSVATTEQFRVPVRQIVQLFYIDPSDIEYRLEVINGQ